MSLVCHRCGESVWNGRWWLSRIVEGVYQAECYRCSEAK